MMAHLRPALSVPDTLASFEGTDPEANFVEGGVIRVM